MPDDPQVDAMAAEINALPPADSAFNPQAESGLFGEIAPAAKNALSAKFTCPPFSVLNARDGWWQDRKRAWLAMGIQSEIGRGAATLDLSPQAIGFAAGTPEFEEYRANRQAARDSRAGGNGADAKTYNSGGPGALGAELKARETASLQGGLAFGATCDPYRAADAKSYNTQEWVKDKGIAGNAAGQSGTSIFDPVLCELCYRWFCPAGGMVIDPFAGGSVRGIVAALLGRGYWGVDLRPEQIAANIAQGEAICPEKPWTWRQGDALTELAAGPAADFIFSCPPYGDLERYSDDPRDLSTMPYHLFMSTYRLVIARACERLKPDRFAAFVVGDYRGRDGAFRNFPGETVAAFRAAGLRLYNEAILVTAVGSLPIRVKQQMISGRKLGKTHQNVLVFVKGDWQAAAAACEAFPED